MSRDEERGFPVYVSHCTSAISFLLNSLTFFKFFQIFLSSHVQILLSSAGIRQRLRHSPAAFRTEISKQRQKSALYTTVLHPKFYYQLMSWNPVELYYHDLEQPVTTEQALPVLYLSRIWWPIRPIDLKTMSLGKCSVLLASSM